MRVNQMNRRSTRSTTKTSHGTSRTVSPDGLVVSTTTTPDGEVVTIYPDGTMTVYRMDGSTITTGTGDGVADTEMADHPRPDDPAPGR